MKRSQYLQRMFSKPSMACLIVALLLPGCRDSDSEAVVEMPSNEQLRFSSQPITKRPLFRLTTEPLHQFDQDNLRFKDQLQKLARYANQLRLSKSKLEMPKVLSGQFETTIVERKQLTSAYLGERVRIARWRLNEKTPTYYDSIALDRLFNTLLEPWKEADRFRIEFKIHTVRDRPNYYDAQILVNIEGSVPSQTVRADGNNELIGRAAIGTWQIVWQKQPDGGEPLIKKINMLAHEETVSYVPDGQLFVDCTASVLRNDEETVNSLSYGLDEWGQRIPWLTVIGDCGMAVGDVNNDGFDDIYICQPHSMPNLLLRQNADGTADDVAKMAGVNLQDDSKAALIVDLDNDRRQDLVVATDSRLVLFSNMGDGKFLLEHQLKIGPGTESLSAADFDKDGDLDLFLAKYRPVAKFNDIFPQPNASINAINGGRNILLRNDEAWNFKDVTSDAGINLNNSNYTQAAVWNDFDADGDLDLYLANEFQQDKLYVNDNGWFTDSFKSALSSKAGNSSTVSVADFNQDGKPDFFVGANNSFENQKITQDYIDSGGKLLRDANGYRPDNRFVSSVDSRNIDQYDFRPPIFSSESSYSSVTGDFNNDGIEDLAITNGWLSRSKQKSLEVRMLRNLFNPEKDLEIISKRELFEMHHEISDQCRSGASFNGFQRNSCFLTIGAKRFANYSNSSGFNEADDSRAIARTDWDGDGDVDLILTNRTAPRLRILKNQYASRNQHLKIRLQGVTSNRDAIGSRIEVFLRGSDTPITRMLTAGSGRKSQSSKELHFGLGRALGIERVVVHWPSGQSQTFTGINTNRTYELVEGKTEAAEFSNDRYRIALADNAIEKKTGLPQLEKKRFFPTARLPIIQFRGPVEKKRQKWFQVENITGRTLLCIFCPSDQNHEDLLREWNSKHQNISKMNADLLIAFTGNDVDNDKELKKYVEQIQAAEFKFRWGVLSESGNQKLAHCLGDWFFDSQLPKTPFAILMDSDGNIHFGYDHDQIIWGQIERDLQNLADKNFVLNQIPDREDEMWSVRKLTPRMDRLVRRYKETGYDRDVTYLERWLPALQSEDYLRRAIDLASKGNLTSALSAAERSAELDPESTDTMITQADIKVQYSKTADQQARTRMLRSAGELLDKALLKEPTNSEAILARAEVFRLQNDIENAINLLLKYLEIDPDNWQVHAIAGRLYFHKREDLNATRYLIAAYENRPKLPYVAGDLGYLYLKNRQFKDAQEFLDLATRLQPSEPNARRHLAEAEYWLGNYERAGQLLETVAPIQPALTHGKQMYAWLRAVSPFKNFRDGKAGLEMIEPFVDLRGDQSPAALEIMAACYAEMGDFDQAMAIQKRAIDAVDNQRSLENYTSEQDAALRDRLELYKRRRAYRIKNAAESPFKLLGASST